LNDLKQAIKDKSRQLGFILAGVTAPQRPEHYRIFENWLEADMHGAMGYLATERSRVRRADPQQILPECKSILVLAIPYSPLPTGGRVGGESATQANIQKAAEPPYREVLEEGDHTARLQIASYALGNDYHDVLPQKLKAIVEFIEQQLGHPIPNRYYTDTGPILERELAQRAGLGWIGKNSMLIHPKAGSTFFLAEILLGIELEPDEPFATDHCGTCTRCIDACPTDCILPGRIVDARRCISYLTIELKEDIPEDLRDKMGNWIFGCDICQQVCPWNRFAQPADPAFEPLIPLPVLASDLTLTSVEFNQRFKRTPVKRARRRGYLRNLAVAVGNTGTEDDIPVLEDAMKDEDALVREHAKWAKGKLERGLPWHRPPPFVPRARTTVRDGRAGAVRQGKMNKLLIATNNKGKVEELQDLLKDLGIELVTPADIDLSLDVHEDGKTYAENATKKALAFARASGLISLADDSGLEVDALDGAPGLYSARYSPKPNAKDSDRRAFLLENLRDKPHPWKAHFHATIAIAKPSGEIELAEGDCHGEIIAEERGAGGFGYDPIFFMPELNKTMAELDMETKNRLSHRARAVINAKPILQRSFKGV
jgi:epoxyqueuosine reductase